jgi:uncharacterized protein YycO
MAILFFNLHNQNKVWLFNKQQTHHTVIWVLFFIKNGKPYVFEGRPYDIWFGWDNKYIYCSELVWEIYDNALT